MLLLWTWLTAVTVVTCISGKIGILHIRIFVAQLTSCSQAVVILCNTALFCVIFLLIWRIFQ